MSVELELVPITIKQLYVMHVRSVIKGLLAQDVYKLLYDIDNVCREVEDIDEDVTIDVTVKDIKFLFNTLSTKQERVFNKINLNLKYALIATLTNLSSDPSKEEIVATLSTHLQNFENETDQMIELAANYEKSLIV